MIDLTNLEPVRINRSLKGKYLLVYGEPKTGKTTLLSQFPKCLILAFEPGYNALDGAMVQPILKWTDFKMVLAQLAMPEVMEKFDFIGFDTADIAYNMCEKYICMQNRVKELGDIPYGKGTSLCTSEFSDSIREIANLGYGLCFVSHSTEKKFQNEKGEEYNRIVPALTARPYGIINKMVDTIGFIHRENTDTEKNKPFLYLRGNDNFLAGSRFRYIAPKIDFSYEAIKNAVSDAVDKQREMNGTSANENGSEENDYFKKSSQRQDFASLMSEAQGEWKRLVDISKDNATVILDFAESIFGQRTKLSEISPSQQDLLELVVEKMKSM